MEPERQGQDEDHRKAEAPDVALALASVRKIQRYVAARPDRDQRSPEEIIGFDEQGLPS